MEDDGLQNWGRDVWIQQQKLRPVQITTVSQANRCRTLSRKNVFILHFVQTHAVIQYFHAYRQPGLVCILKWITLRCIKCCKEEQPTSIFASFLSLPLTHGDNNYAAPRRRTWIWIQSSANRISNQGNADVVEYQTNTHTHTHFCLVLPSSRLTSRYKGTQSRRGGRGCRS